MLHTAWAAKHRRQRWNSVGVSKREKQHWKLKALSSMNNRMHHTSLRWPRLVANHIHTLFILSTLNLTVCQLFHIVAWQAVLCLNWCQLFIMVFNTGLTHYTRIVDLCFYPFIVLFVCNRRITNRRWWPGLFFITSSGQKKKGVLMKYLVLHPQHMCTVLHHDWAYCFAIFCVFVCALLMLTVHFWRTIHSFCLLCCLTR